MFSDILEAVKARKFFYRNLYRGSLTTLIVVLIINGLILVSIIYMLLNQQEPKYYATMSNGELMELKAYNQPNMSSEYLLPSDPSEITPNSAEKPQL